MVQGTPLFTTLPLLDEPLVVASPEGKRVAVVQRTASGSPASPKSYVVHVIRQDGTTLFDRRQEYLPKPLSDRTFDSLAQVVANRPPRASPAEIASAMHRMPYLPPVSRALFGVDSSLWVERERAGQSSVLCDVFDAAGRHVGTVTLGASQRIVAATLGGIWVAAIDADDMLRVSYSILR
jgi:hypothetical protein